MGHSLKARRLLQDIRKEDKMIWPQFSLQALEMKLYQIYSIKRIDITRMNSAIYFNLDKILIYN